MSGASIEFLHQLHDEVAKDLLRRIKSGEATASDISNAIKLLKDNGIEAEPAKGSAMGDLLDGLDIDNVVQLEERVGSK